MNRKIKSLIALFFLLQTTSSFAGLYTDDLSRCLIERSSPEDKIILVKWMFTAMALHPAVNTLATVPDEQREVANKAVADLFVNLLTDRCNEQVLKAMKYEGNQALSAGFKVLGSVAGQELFANPAVTGGLAKLNKHIDMDKLGKSLGLPRSKK